MHFVEVHHGIDFFQRVSGVSRLENHVFVLLFEANPVVWSRPYLPGRLDARAAPSSVRIRYPVTVEVPCSVFTRASSHRNRFDICGFRKSTPFPYNAVLETESDAIFQHPGMPLEDGNVFHLRVQRECDDR